MPDLRLMWERYKRRVDDTNDRLGEIIEIPLSYEEYCDMWFDLNREY